jgi:phosphoglycolate phosphatase
MNKLLMFDVDNTLVKASNIHKLSFSVAIKQIYDVAIRVDDINHHGMTDQQIIFDLLQKKGLSEEEINPKLVDCMKAMINYYIDHIDKDNVVVFEGVVELIKELYNRGHSLALVTGNLEAIARMKLEKVGLNQYFNFGGFGSEHIDRTELVRLAIKRAGSSFNIKRNSQIYLFGDTPQDIKSGNTVGITTIGVATGIYSSRELYSAGADYVLEDLRNTDRVIAIVLS